MQCTKTTDRFFKVYRFMVRDEDCVAFLQWALPRLRMRWPGYRKVRRQVCRRIARRMRALELADIDQYCTYLEEHEDEWAELDAACRITISRFYRDRGVFDAIGDRILPELARTAAPRESREIRCWCAGCASGEEPYSLRLIWKLKLAERFPDCALGIVATDSDDYLLQRAEQALYRASSLKEIPDNWRNEAFDSVENGFRLKPEFRQDVEFRREDIREDMPDGPFDLILCRNLIFTYYSKALQRELAPRLIERLAEGGFLVLGIHETLPEGVVDLQPWDRHNRIYKK